MNRSLYFSCLPSSRSPQIAFIRELRAVLLCSFHFSVPLWRPHRDVNQSTLPSFQNNSKVRLPASTAVDPTSTTFLILVTSYDPCDPSLARARSLTLSFSLFLRVTLESTAWKMETSMHLHGRGEKERESVLSRGSRTSARSSPDAAKNNGRLACPAGMISSPEDILANIGSCGCTRGEVNFYRASSRISK